MTECVVDGLESIEIEIEDSRSSRIVTQTRFESFEESGAVEEATQFVVPCGVAESLEFGAMTTIASSD